MAGSIEGKEVTVWMKRDEEDQIGPAGKFTGILKEFLPRETGYIIVNMPTGLGSWREVIVPWDNIRYITYEGTRPR